MSESTTPTRTPNRGGIPQWVLENSGQVPLYPKETPAPPEPPEPAPRASTPAQQRPPASRAPTPAQQPPAPASRAPIRVQEPPPPPDLLPALDSLPALDPLPDPDALPPLEPLPAFDALPPLDPASEPESPPEPKSKRKRWGRKKRASKQEEAPPAPPEEPLASLPAPQPRSLRDIAAAIRKSRQGALPSIAAFPPVHADEIVSELKLYVRAAESGQQDEPASNATAPDPAEAEIGTAIESRARQAAEHYRSQIDLYDARIRSAAITGAERAQIEAAGESALAELETRVTSDLDHLQNWRDALREVETEFRSFRAHNGLRRLPRLVSIREKLLRTLILLVALMLGVVLEGRFFGAGIKALPVGAMAQALIVSLLNAGPALFYARRSLPHVVDHGFGAKLVGAVSTCVFLGWTLAINLFVAHCRDVSVAHGGVVQLSELTRRLTLGLTTLDDSDSWLLAAVGVGLSVVTVLVAAGMEELYPGYGALGRIRAAAMQAYRSEASRCVEGLAAVRDAALQNIGAGIEELRGLEQELQVAAEGRNRIHRELAAHLDDLAGIHDRLCRRYREINEHSRSDDPPRYFRLAVQPPALLARLDPPAPKELVPEARVPAIEQMEQYTRSIEAAFSDAMPRYEIEELPPDETYESDESDEW